MLPHYFPSHDKDIVDMDTQERIRYMSESSMSGTSGYNTTSPGPGNSPISSGYSPVQSPASALNSDFSNLALPGISHQQQNPPQYVQLQNVQITTNNNIQQQMTAAATIMYPNQNNQTIAYNFGNPINYQQSTQQTLYAVKHEYQATLRIVEQPVEKFRFRYKSEMHGTHGSLNGTNSQRNTKSFPEVELRNYKGPAIIRCSLFQTNLDSPHSHQLVVRKDDHDICDPHEIKVCHEVGYFAEFKNMGIIHTAKKFIVEELLKKKRKRLLFELGRDSLTTKEEQELHKQTEKEAKDMNLNQVRLCFEAFYVEDNNFYTPIAAPVYSNPINNRKSAQTGELRITRLSIATGNVSGGEDLILLVEKVSKKNIKVRFFEMNEDEQVWESFATFRESDVHHQYAIVCRTPAYKDKGIDKSVEVFIELVRPSDDERSYPPVSFRYKPSDAVISRKRRRTCSSLSGSSSSNSGSLSSGEIPKTVQEQQSSGINMSRIVSDEINRLMNDPELKLKSTSFSDFENMLDILGNDPIMMNNDININVNNGTAEEGGRTEKDGACVSDTKSILHYKKIMISKKLMDTAKTTEQQHQLQQSSNQLSNNTYIQRIFNIFTDTRSSMPLNNTQLTSAAEQITKIFNEHSDKNKDSLIHEIVLNDNNKLAIPLFKIFEFFKLNHLLNTNLNNFNQTALHYACLHDRPLYIRPLLKLGCYPNIQDKDGNTALHIAVREKHLKCLESFINSGMPLNLNILNYDGFTTLHLAIRDTNYDIASKLLKYDENIAAVANRKDGNNALHMVIQQQNIQMIKLILDYPIVKSIINAQNTAGNTPIELAKQLASCSKEAQEIFKLLLIHGKNVSSNSTQPRTSDNNRLSVDDDGKLVIKEENSCSSTEDDEDDNSSIEQMVTIPSMSIIHEDEIDIKQEIFEYFDTSDLMAALHNNEIFAKLCMHLDQNNGWQKLAEKIQKTRIYITNAKGLLNTIKRDVRTIDCTLFAEALHDIDERLIDLIKKQ